MGDRHAAWERGRDTWYGREGGSEERRGVGGQRGVVERGIEEIRRDMWFGREM